MFVLSGHMTYFQELVTSGMTSMAAHRESVHSTNLLKVLQRRPSSATLTATCESDLQVFMFERSQNISDVFGGNSLAEA